jgi:hypothetical protein
MKDTIGVCASRVCWVVQFVYACQTSPALDAAHPLQGYPCPRTVPVRSIIMTQARSSSQQRSNLIVRARGTLANMRFCPPRGRCVRCCRLLPSLQRDLRYARSTLHDGVRHVCALTWMPLVTAALFNLHCSYYVVSMRVVCTHRPHPACQARAEYSGIFDSVLSSEFTLICIWYRWLAFPPFLLLASWVPQQCSKLHISYCCTYTQLQVNTGAYIWARVHTHNCTHCHTRLHTQSYRWSHSYIHSCTA